ncbi:putative aflatoxin biosynthesis ketoreductase nor-1 [Acephala macrosclerotiorum]|nr:putative aflatoxin biosynthesis ketoreductase nor-1 [Acephala macrosclerotiorum]
MAPKYTYLITGANRGIGLGLTRALLQRPDTAVIATVRDEKTNLDGLHAIHTAEGSELIIERYSPTDQSSPYTAAALATQLQKPEQTHVPNIDVIIANLGIGDEFKSTLDTTPESILIHFQTNALAPISLFQSLFPLLSKSQQPKFILISSSLGSIGEMEGAAPTLAYGISKAGANYFVRKVHYEHKEIVSLAIHPGWVKTGNGQNFADSIGVQEPPMTLEESAAGVLKQIDAATRETTSGSFLSFDGSAIQW